MAVTWLSWGSPALAARPAAPTSLSAAQTAQISKARTQLTTAQSRLDELQRYIASEDWTNTSNFIHGPLGDLRRQAATINRNLLSSKDQQKARSQARELMAHIERSTWPPRTAMPVSQPRNTVSRWQISLPISTSFPLSGHDPR